MLFAAVQLGNVTGGSWVVCRGLGSLLTAPLVLDPRALFICGKL